MKQLFSRTVYWNWERVFDCYFMHETRSLIAWFNILLSLILCMIWIKRSCSYHNSAWTVDKRKSFIRIGINLGINRKVDELMIEWLKRWNWLNELCFSLIDLILNIICLLKLSKTPVLFFADCSENRFSLVQSLTCMLY